MKLAGEEAEYGSHVEEMDENMWILKNQNHFLTTYIWDVLNVTADQMKSMIGQYTKMYESRMSAGATEKSPGWEKPHARDGCVVTSTWKDNAPKCVERYCELANKKVEQLILCFKSLLG